MRSNQFRRTRETELLDPVDKIGLQGSIARGKLTLQRQIKATDRQIDALVYELYGLTEEEIAIV